MNFNALSGNVSREGNVDNTRVSKTLSAFVPDTEGLKLELSEQAWMLEQSVTANGKLMSKQYWLKQLKKVGWMKRLSGLICTPSQHQSFVEKYRGLTCGYPCQPFSSSGKRKGQEDPRHLWPKIREHARAIGVQWIFAENVEGHISLGLSTVISDLEEDGYKVAAGIFSSEEVGAPHRRRRVFILGNSTSKRSCRGGNETSLASNQKCLGRDLKMWPSPRAGNQAVASPERVARY